MEKEWCVEVWGDFGGGFTTETFYTKREAVAYFKSIRKTLDSSKYLFNKESIVSIANPEESVVLSNLREI